MSYYKNKEEEKEDKNSSRKRNKVCGLFLSKKKLNIFNLKLDLLSNKQTEVLSLSLSLYCLPNSCTTLHIKNPDCWKCITLAFNNKLKNRDSNSNFNFFLDIMRVIHFQQSRFLICKCSCSPYYYKPLGPMQSHFSCRLSNKKKCIYIQVWCRYINYYYYLFICLSIYLCMYVRTFLFVCSSITKTRQCFWHNNNKYSQRCTLEIHKRHFHIHEIGDILIIYSSFQVVFYQQQQQQQNNLFYVRLFII